MIVKVVLMKIAILVHPVILNVLNVVLIPINVVNVNIHRIELFQNVIVMMGILEI